MCRHTSNQRNNLRVKECQNHIRHRIFYQSPLLHREENYNNVNCLAIRIALFDNDLADINRRSNRTKCVAASNFHPQLSPDNASVVYTKKSSIPCPDFTRGNGRKVDRISKTLFPSLSLLAVDR